MPARLRPALLLPLIALCLGLSSAATLAAEKENPDDALITASEGFLGEHPDLRWRWRGLRAYREGNFEEALGYFRRAARYADKPSQGMVAEMLWKGQGTPVDRPLAYAWMDLAAERHYPVMLINRERYWAAMSEAERQQALVIGESVYEEFGDDVAKERLESVLRRARRNVTGSRTGFVGALQIEIPTPAGPMVIDGASYYAEKFWEPEQYWSWQDQDWKVPPKGRVDIGSVQEVASPPANDEEAADGR